MTRRKLEWWVPQLVGPVLFTGLAIPRLADGEWVAALSCAIFALALVINIRTSYWSFRAGWARGQRDALEAMTRAQSMSEFIRLTDVPPKPWS